MLDADGSGALDSDEIIQAFKLINMPTSKSKITALMGDVLVNDEDAELDYEDFELLMTRRMNDTAVDSSSGDSLAAVMPFHEIANAFRRKKTLEAFMKGGQDRQSIIDSEYFKQRRTVAQKRWRMPGMKSRFAKLFNGKGKGKRMDFGGKDTNKSGAFDDKLRELKSEVEELQEDTEASSRVLEIFTASSHFHSPQGTSFDTPGLGWERIRAKLKTGRKSTVGSSTPSSSVFVSPEGSRGFRPSTCPTYVESKSVPVATNLKTGLEFQTAGPPSPDYIPPLTPAPRRLEHDFDSEHDREKMETALESLRSRDELEKLRPTTSAAVDASEIRYAAYWRACRKDFFDADIVQAKAQIVMAKVKPPKVEVNPWAVTHKDGHKKASTGYDKLYSRGTTPRSAPRLSDLIASVGEGGSR